MLINNMRMQEIAEVLTSRIAEYDRDFAREVLIDELDMDNEELHYFGISKGDLEPEDDGKDDEDNSYFEDDILLDWIL